MDVFLIISITFINAVILAVLLCGVKNVTVSQLAGKSQKYAAVGSVIAIIAFYISLLIV